MQVTVVTSCVNRKRIVPDENLRAGNLPIGSFEEVADEWNARVAVPHRTKRQAKDVYCGRAFQEALKAAEELKTRLWIISAG